MTSENPVNVGQAQMFGLRGTRDPFPFHGCLGVAPAEGRRAKVLFSGLGNNQAAFDYDAASCSALYCHGDGRNQSGPVSWTANQAVGCSSSHCFWVLPPMG